MQALIDAAAAQSEHAPWAYLLELWSQPNPAAAARAAAGCAFAQADGLYCVRGLARLDRLVALERPVLLRLRAGPAQAWAVLLGADSRRVRVWLGGRRVEIDRITLPRHWNGEYAALWRGPTGLTLPLGADSARLAWLQRELGPGYVAQAGAADDATLQAAVRRLQADRGLAVDGVPGPETLMALAADDGPGPRLAERLD
ncbi:peptidoglycan-binding protein [Agrilutibacter solisilvae]|uniref:Peptidoglycan-binding protein n=1 Tax=Agrilutibacter solisilvae TaxID=2763317 RepID=A0A975AQR6_9GAMM|nr:peptidoglycan-binding domain-containing protein [Lysobacter solisilvae]QSX76987.1 peptidoglycan-binding protein [Lysobacter solisilvae]